MFLCFEKYSEKVGSRRHAQNVRTVQKNIIDTIFSTQLEVFWLCFLHFTRETKHAITQIIAIKGCNLRKSSYCFALNKYIKQFIYYIQFHKIQNPFFKHHFFCKIRILLKIEVK